MTAQRVIWGAAFWLCSVLGGAAQVVSVASGEHEGFTRLALTFGAPVDWQVQRQADGYVLSVAGEAPRYDLGRVFQRIARDRLAAIWVDPETGALRLAVGCACHALPFEYRPGILVIDLRDGPPPPASAFELAADGTRMAALTQRAPFRPRSQGVGGNPDTPRVPGYDWIALATGDPLPPLAPIASERPDGADARPAPMRHPDGSPPQGADLAGLRAALFDDLARGAVRGAVSLRLPVQANGGAQEDLAQVQVHAADDLAAMIRLHDADTTAAALTASGAVCHGDGALALASWGDARPAALALGPLTSGLYGEFDKVDRDAAARAVRYLLFLGFGAEARNMIRSLDLAGPDAAIWATMAEVADGGTDPGGAFAGMAACDTAAAVWSVLADGVGDTEGTVNTAALLRAFSDLPPGLRRHLGRAVADRMLARDDTATARAVLLAMDRVPDGAGPGATLVAAALAAKAGEAPDLATLQQIRAATGPEGVMATVTLIRAALALGEAVDPALIAETEARATEFAGTPEEPPLRQALAEAHASQGNFPRAFEITGDRGPGAAPVWSHLADHGTISSLLDHAVLSAQAELPEVTISVRRAIARRLLDGGFADAAMVWADVGGEGPAALPASIESGDRELVAEAHLMRRDGAAAMRQLAGLDTPTADALRLRAMAMLDDPAARALADVLKDAAMADALARKARDWARVSGNGEGAWGQAARRALPSPGTDAPPLAQSRALLAESAMARADLAALLAATALANR